ncbi:bifunctional DnaQ family exonuclease/ATP-dependent helicase [Streptococcus didelphis]|uniref:bifunctional DnaQ family exonuclease/ATP-dependent helicase n=1 Tax=Streptococcus didelphis TaxID=102886 RepID=UPI000374C0CE|nr:bifunctional DnaQ family exonuclease/ATP-dependent helicase [Streptococcus didelphis]
MTIESFKKYAVIDLEATGTGSQASIIQVGIVIIEGNQIIETYQTDVNPHEKLSEHIKSLTGISDQQLEAAPDFEQVAKEIFDLISDCFFVAHNVKFDANLLAESLFFEGYELRTPRIDTVELAQVFYPTLEKYSLTYLSQVLNLELSEAHTAIADARATAKLFLQIQDKLKSIPLETLESLATFSDNLLFESGIVINQALAAAKPYDNNKYTKVNGIILRKEERIPSPLKLSQDFSINRSLLDLEVRPLQDQFAQLVEEAFLQAQPSFIQAQAGIGKTYGYLLPLLARAEGNQILISVPTKVLQDQIMGQELTILREAFQLSCHSLKSPANYLKLDSFQASLEELEDNRLVNRYKMQLLVWLLETKSGDLDEIKQKQRFATYFDQIKHDGQLLSSSAFYDYDFWNRSYHKAKQANVLVTNHAYFLHRVEDDKVFAKGKILVFDEAQTLPLQLDQLAHKQLQLTSFLQELQEAIQTPASLLEKRLLESLSFELNQALETYYHKQGHVNDSDNKDFKRIKDLVGELGSASFEQVKAFFKDQEADYWISHELKNEKRVSYLNSSSKHYINFSQFLPETLKTYFISATLQISPQVSLADLLGFEAYTYAQIEHQKSAKQLLLVDSSMPLVSQTSPQDYCQEIAKRLVGLSQLKKPILILFTSRQYMLLVSSFLDEAAIPHLAQEKNGSSYNVKKRFDRGEQTLLLGMGSFWEGVDFVHANQMITVIARLPFDNPKDLFVTKMSHYLLSQNKLPFKDYFLPMTILRLKQAIGRTLRRSDQRSVVLILDSRILVKEYGQEIFSSLGQDFSIKSEKFEDSFLEIEQFLI